MVLPPPPLSAEVLARRDHLPGKPAPAYLSSGDVEVRPLDLDRDVAALHASSGDERVWRWMSGGPFADALELRAWLARQDAAPDGRPFTVLSAGRPVGVANLMANQPAHLKIERGS